MLRINKPKTHTANIRQQMEDQEYNEWGVGFTKLNSLIITISYYAFLN